MWGKLIERIAVVLIILCLISNTAFAEIIGSTSELKSQGIIQPPKTAYERLKTIAEREVKLKKRTGIIVMGCALGTIIGPVYNIVISPGEYESIGLLFGSALIIIGVPFILLGNSIKNNASNTYTHNELRLLDSEADLDKRKKQAEEILSGRAKKGRIHRIIRGSALGLASVVYLYLGSYSLYKDIMVFSEISAGVLGGLSIYTFLKPSFNEREYNAYQNDRKLTETMIFPLITLKYQGIMIAKRF